MSKGSPFGITKVNEPRHESSNNVVCMVCAPSKGSDQPAHTRSLIRAFACRLNIIYIKLKLLTEQHLEFLSLTGDRTGSSESTLVKMPQCWKSHIMAQMLIARGCVFYHILTQQCSFVCSSFGFKCVLKSSQKFLITLRCDMS